MVRENVSVDTSFDAFILFTLLFFFQLFSHSTHFEMEKKKNEIIFPYWIKWVLFYALYGMTFLTQIISNAITFWLKYTLAVFP